MDRSFLGRPEVISASRAFVCVRLNTYEDADEGLFLKSLMTTRSGELENSVFTLLSPDGTTPLARAGRSPHREFADAAELAQAMRDLARRHPGRAARTDPPPLPAVARVTLALNVAACDNQPLLLLHGTPADLGPDLERQLRALVWSEPFIGRFVIARSRQPEDLGGIVEPKSASAIMILQPDAFGQKATLLARGEATSSPEQLAALLRQGLAKFEGKEKAMRAHLREGRSAGVFYTPPQPVTDPQERRARQRP